MREITKEEFEEETIQGTGFCNFMGGTSTKNGRNILEVDGKLYLFEDPKNDPEYEIMFDKQFLESKKFIENIWSKI